MKTLYLECNMGAAGDMLMAALLELHPDPQDFIHRLNHLGIPNVEVTSITSVKCGISGTHVDVKVKGIEEESMDVSLHDHHDHEGHEHHHDHEEHEHHHDHDHEDHGHHHDHEEHEHDHDHDHKEHGHHHDHESHEHHHHDHEEHGHEHTEHSHSGMGEIEHLLYHLPVSEVVRKNALGIYQLIAQAESHAHNAPIDQIHFHEVGNMDAVTDIVGVCLLIEELAPEKIIASAIHVGSGQVRCSHGILPVPAPATAFILQGVPMYSGAVKGELCTPTGAAILKHFVSEFKPMPVMKVEKIGYGMGKKDFEAANCVRAFLGETEDKGSEVLELICNLDDMNAEAIGFAMETFFENGALDVYTTPIGMKKSRPGIMLTVMCRIEQKDEMLHLIFQHTTTLGIRVNRYERHMLKRSEETVDTAFGTIRVKRSAGYGVEKAKFEYEDLAAIARKNKLSIDTILKKIK
jgi:uncharacterized protein (TIGR00299 family) protein